MSADGFLLGHIIDPASGDRSGGDVAYDPGDLTTHGVIVGMTGSGKTGLGVILLEEALLAGLPTLVIDPKGDMGNLELLFPDFAGSDFEPWVSADEARKDGITPAELGQKTADMWKKGISGWDPGLEAIRRLRDAVDVTIYTPGSAAGVPVNVVGSLAAPDLDWDIDAEAGRDEIEGFVSSLLTLAGIDADPLSAPEHILLANIIEHSWSAGRDLDMASLIGQVQEPPMRKLGRVRGRRLLPTQGPHRAGHAAQRPRRLSIVRGLVGGCPARHPVHAVRAGWKPAGRHRLSGPPVR